MFEEVKRLRHLICQHQQWWLRIAHKMQEPRSPREIAAVNIRTLPRPGSRDQPGRWACKCSTLMSPKTKDQMASPTFYPTSRPPKIFLSSNVIYKVYQKKLRTESEDQRVVELKTNDFTSFLSRCNLDLINQFTICVFTCLFTFTKLKPLLTVCWATSVKV